MSIINTIISGGGQQPSGTITITSNTTTNVAQYEYAVTAVPTTAPALYREFQLLGGMLIADRSTTHIMDFTGMTDISDYALARAYYQNTAISGSVDMSDLTTISGQYACEAMFYNCTAITGIDLSSLTTISGNYGCSNMFQACTGIISADLSSLTTLSGSQACVGMFTGCTSLATVYIGGTTAIDFGTRTNQFSSMFSGCTQNIDVYAPAANQAQIESFSGYPNFSGTGTVTWHWRS